MGLRKNRFFTYLFLLSGFVGYCQHSFELCDEPYLDCQDGNSAGTYMISSLQLNGGIYTSPGNTMPFWIGKKDALTGKIDTSSLSTNLGFGTLTGPGLLTGTMSVVGFFGYTYLNDWIFTEPGEYKIMTYVAGSAIDSLEFTVAEEVDLCNVNPVYDCGPISSGDSIFSFRSNIVSVDAVYPITVGLVDTKTKIIDSTFIGEGVIKKISGPGYFSGSKQIFGSKWLQFVDLKFDLEGEYELEITLTDTAKAKTLKDTVVVLVVGGNGVSESKAKVLKSYPNPTQNRFIVQLPNSNAIILEVFNYNGQKVMFKQIENESFLEVDLSAFDNGLYFVQLFQNNFKIGETTVVKLK